jgi:hypothetical protein
LDVSRVLAAETILILFNRVPGGRELHYVAPRCGQLQTLLRPARAINEQSIDRVTAQPPSEVLRRHSATGSRLADASGLAVAGPLTVRQDPLDRPVH